jgi:hypothetical protein
LISPLSEVSRFRRYLRGRRRSIHPTWPRRAAKTATEQQRVQARTALDQYRQNVFPNNQRALSTITSRDSMPASAWSKFNRPTLGLDLPVPIEGKNIGYVTSSQLQSFVGQCLRVVELVLVAAPACLTRAQWHLKWHRGEQVAPRTGRLTDATVSALIERRASHSRWFRMGLYLA